MSKTTTAVFRGKLSYAKVLGDPVKNRFEEDAREWTFDLVIDDNLVKEAKALGIADRVKRKETYLDGKPYLSFKQRELRKDGTENSPIEVKDILGNDWDQKKKLGNDTVADVRFNVVDFGPGKKRGLYPKSIRILDHVPYGGDDFGEIDESDEFYQAAVAAKASQEKAREIAEAEAVIAAAGASDNDLNDDPF